MRELVRNFHVHLKLTIEDYLKTIDSDGSTRIGRQRVEMGAQFIVGYICVLTSTRYDFEHQRRFDVLIINAEL